MSFTYTLEYSEPGEADRTYLLVDQYPPNDIIDSYQVAYRSSGRKRSYSPLTIRTAYEPRCYREFKARRTDLSEIVLTTALGGFAVALGCALILISWLLLGVLSFVIGLVSVFYTVSCRTQEWRNDAARRFHDWVNEHQVDNTLNGGLAPHVAWALRVEREVHYPPMDVMVRAERFEDLVVKSLPKCACKADGPCRHELAKLPTFLYLTRTSREVNVTSSRVKKVFPGAYELACSDYQKAKQATLESTNCIAQIRARYGEHGKACLEQIADDSYIRGAYDLHMRATANAEVDGYAYVETETKQLEGVRREVASRVEQLLNFAESQVQCDNEATHAGFEAVARSLELYE